jgi:hypothetical protein
MDARLSCNRSGNFGRRERQLRNPASPIDVTNADQKLRITLVPASMIGVSSTGQVKAKIAPLKKESAANPPFFVEVTIGPR